MTRMMNNEEFAAINRYHDRPRRDERAIWAEYDMAAEWCAKRGYFKIGDPLPNLLGGDTCDLIQCDPEAFLCRVRGTAYMLAREGKE
jgi:hypothetical protein